MDHTTETGAAGKLEDLMRKIPGFGGYLDRERRRAEEGQPGLIRAKMNALVDEDIIRALYDASKAGVKVKLNVRGICCLRPGLKGVSENIEVVSIIDRYLEHSRIYHFWNGGDEEHYIASADWMPRNLDRRIELMTHITSKDAVERLSSILDWFFEDNQKARVLDADGAYHRRKPGKGEDVFRVQTRLYEDAKSRADTLRAVVKWKWTQSISKTAIFLAYIAVPYNAVLLDCVQRGGYLS